MLRIIAIYGNDTVHRAENDGDIELVKYLLLLGADVNACSGQDLRNRSKFCLDHAKQKMIDAYFAI